MNDRALLEAVQTDFISPADELALAKASPGGAWLSPAAQALNDVEGAARFAASHTRRCIVCRSSLAFFPCRCNRRAAASLAPVDGDAR